MYSLTQNDSYIDYYVRLMSLRQKALTNGEDSLYDANLFKNTIFTCSINWDKKWKCQKLHSVTIEKPNYY